MLRMNKQWLAFVFLTSWGLALANTEIINFVVHTRDEVIVTQTPDWPILHGRKNEGRWSIQPAPLHTVLESVCEPQAGRSMPDEHASLCPHELWVILDFDDDAWRRFDKFTLRLSWPAFYPTEFLIQLYDSDGLRSRYGRPGAGTDEQSNPHPRSRRKYARIRLVDTGILTPPAGPAMSPSTDPGDAQSHRISNVTMVPFDLILEPLYFGVLPESVLPVVCFLVPVVLLAGLMVPFITGYLEQIVRAVRQETGSITRREKSE